MFLKVELPWNILIPPENLDAKGLLLQRAILLRLLDEFARRKGTKEHGYFIAVTTLKNIGEGKVRSDCGSILFPVTFNCVTFKPFKGEVLRGVVKQVLQSGIFLTAGPVETVFIPVQDMPNYQHVASAENPSFMDELSKIEKDVNVRFVVRGTRWIETKREFEVLGSLKGDFLGPF
ncbi:hypothetical protein ACHQM5_014541 [Ranunculus cassubicifolius]